MSISFTQFPLNFNVPGIYAEYSNAGNAGAAAALPQKILVLGQMLDAGTATPEVPVLAVSDDQAGQLAGRGSMLHHLVRTALQASAGIPVWMMPLEDDGAGTASTRTITVATAPSAAGTIALYVGGRRYQVGVASDDEEADVATAIAAAINADDLRHVDAEAELAEVTLTARNAGVDAGNISCIVNRYSDERLPASLTLTISALTPGTGNPALTSAITALSNIWYPSITQPYTDATNVAAVVAELERRNGPIPQIEAVAFTAVSDTVQNLLTAAASHNSPFVCLGDAGDYLSPPWLWGASACGVQASLAQTDPALPEQTTVMPGLVAKAESERRSITDRQTLLAGGVATSIVDGGGLVRAERFATTYRTNAFGVPDRSRFDICHTRLWAQTRFGLRSRFSTKYAQYKLGKNGSTGPRVMTPALAASELIAFYKGYVDLGWYEGGEAFEQFKRELRTEIDATDPNRLNALFPPDFMNQLRVTAALVQPVG